MATPPQKAHQPASVTFPVDDVAPSDRHIWTEPLHTHIERRLLRKLFALPDSTHAVTNFTYDQFLTAPEDVRSRVPTIDQVQPSQDHRYGDRSHPLIRAAAEAFARHLPLTLSPDAIWLVIEQGFSHHVSKHAESLRPKLVRHEGKRGLKVESPFPFPSGVELAIGQVCTQIRALTNPVLYETLVCNFSTTTSAIRTASEVVLMDCYSSYFGYFMDCICGIPKITLTGTVEDWQRIRARVEVFEDYDLTWWVARLRPILDQFVRTAEGHPDLPFWKAIYKPRSAYGTRTVTGWIADLFPYLNDPPKRVRNHVFQYPRQDWALPIHQGVDTVTFEDPQLPLPPTLPAITSGMGEPGANKGVRPDSFPSGLASVPVSVSEAGAGLRAGVGAGLPERQDISLVAGFFAVEQSPHTLALSPLISWAVAEPVPSKPVSVGLRPRF